MKQKGFGLIITIITFAIIMLLAGGIYFSKNSQKSGVERGNDAIQQAENAVKILEDIDNERGKELLK